MAETENDYTDFTEKLTRGEERELTLLGTKTVSGTESPLNFSTGELWLIGKKPTATRTKRPRSGSARR